MKFVYFSLSSFFKGVLVVYTLLSPALSDAEPQFESRSFIDDLLLRRKDIPLNALGLNAFANEPQFGSVRSQLVETRNQLGIRFLRVLFAWNDQVQPSPTAPINFSFYDDIERSIPAGSEALVVLTGMPTWMFDSKNWINGEPRETFVRNWVGKVVNRYKTSAKIRAWQVWNEPNMEANRDNGLLDISKKPENYVAMLRRSYEVIKILTPRSFVVSAATTSITQNFPKTLNYMKGLLSNGLQASCDIVGIHYYSIRLENLLRPGGVEDLFRSIKKGIWITESGEKGISKQRNFAMKLFPYLLEKYKNINRIYYYQFTEGTDARTTYGLKSNGGVSDLYRYLRERRR
jgi:hypothetical protein